MDRPEPLTDVALMVRVRGGDQEAFGALHARYQTKLLAFFHGLSHNSHVANDLCQETFLRVWKVRRRYHATGAFAGYLFAIARMIWRERQRTMAQAARLGPSQDLRAAEGVRLAGAETPDGSAVRSEMGRCIHAALEELPEAQRMVFVLRHIQGLSLRDIAEAMDCPVNTVRARKLLAVKKLRRLLADVYPLALDRVL